MLKGTVCLLPNNQSAGSVRDKPVRRDTRVRLTGGTTGGRVRLRSCEKDTWTANSSLLHYWKSPGRRKRNRSVEPQVPQVWEIRILRSLYPCYSNLFIRPTQFGILLLSLYLRYLTCNFQSMTTLHCETNCIHLYSICNLPLKYHLIRNQNLQLRSSISTEEYDKLTFMQRASNPSEADHAPSVKP